MKKLLQSRFFRLFLFSAVIVSALITVFYCFQYIPGEEKLLRNDLFDRAKTIFDLSSDNLTKALRSRDDIAMLDRIESIMKSEDVSTAYILDNDLKVLTHDKTGEWGKVLTDKTARNAVEAKKMLKQKTPTGYLFSKPLTSSATLCVGMSTQKLDEAVSSLKNRSFFTALIAFLLACVGFFGFIYMAVFPEFKALREGLRSIELGGSGHLPEGAPDGEFGELQRLVNSVLAKAGAGITAGTGSQDLKRSMLIIDNLVRTLDGGIMVIDGDNRILSLNQKAGELFGIEAKGSVGKHILDAIKLPSLLSLVKASAQKPGQTVEETVVARRVKAVAAAEQAGIIVFFQ